MSVHDTVYDRLPAWAQNSAVTAYGYYRRALRFGGDASVTRQAFEKREIWSGEALDEWITDRLRRLLHHARERTPHYRRTLSKVDPEAVTLENLAALPTTTKEEVRRSPESFLSRRLWPLDLTYPTSGSTGTPLSTHWTTAEYRTAFALREARSARWAGVSFEEPRATFSGRLVVPERLRHGAPYRFNRAERQIYFSVFHLSPDAAPRYVEAMHRHRPVWLTGYAVSNYLLARYILEQDLEVPPLRAVVTTSEKVTREMRQVMERAYACRVYEEYSSVENAAFASECERGRLHVSSDATVVEILRPDGTACAPGEDGEVVGTSLFRRLQPLVRFRVGDHARWAAKICPCGRPFPVIEEVVGRTEDVVVGPDGRRMVRFHGIFLDLPGVREGQIIQEEVDSIRVRVAAAEDYDRATDEEIASRLRRRLGERMRIVVEPVEAIPRSPAGKFQAVVSRLDRS